MNLNNYKYVVLDFDGTICKLNVDWSALKAEIVQRFSGNYSFTAPFKLIDGIEAIYKSGIVSDKEELLSIIKEYEQPRGDVHLSDFNEELIHCIETFYVISNNLHSTVELALQKLKISSRCASIIGLDDTDRPKPWINPFNLLQAITHDANTKNYVFIGDSETDKTFARNAGITYIHVNDIKNAI